MPGTSPPRPRSHGKLPRFLTAGEGTDGNDENADVGDVDVGSRKGDPNANNVPEMGAGARCGSHPPTTRVGTADASPDQKSVDLPPEALPSERHASTFPSKRYPTNATLPPSRIREDGVIAVGRVQRRARAGDTARAGASSCRRGGSYRGIRGLRGAQEGAPAASSVKQACNK